MIYPLPPKPLLRVREPDDGDTRETRPVEPSESRMVVQSFGFKKHVTRFCSYQCSLPAFKHGLCASQDPVIWLRGLKYGECAASQINLSIRDATPRIAARYVSAAYLQDQRMFADILDAKSSMEIERQGFCTADVLVFLKTACGLRYNHVLQCHC